MINCCRRKNIDLEYRISSVGSPGRLPRKAHACPRQNDVTGGIMASANRQVAFQYIQANAVTSHYTRACQTATQTAK